MLHATAGIVRCGGFYAAVGMFRIRAAILQEHFARGYSDVVPHAAALKGCSFPNNQTPRYGFQTVPGCLIVRKRTAYQGRSVRKHV